LHVNLYSCKKVLASLQDQVLIYFSIHNSVED